MRQHRLERGPASIGYACQQHILLRREMNPGAEQPHDPSHRGPEPHILGIEDPSVLDEQPVERAAFPLILPPQVIVHVAHPHGRRRRQCAAQPLLHLRAEPVEAPIVQQILEARVPAVAAVAVVALHRQYRLGDLDHVFRCGKPQRIGESRVGDLLAVGHPQPPTDQHVESGNAVPVGDRQETQIVAVDVGAVVVRKRYRRLELARQIALAVDRIGLGRRRPGRDRLAVEPDLVVGARAGEQVLGDAAGHLEHLIAQPAGERRRAAHHVALHVAAGAERRDERVVQLADRSLQVALHHAVKLVVLSRRDPQRAVAVAARQLVEHEVLPGGEDAARDLAADHEGVVGLEAGIAALAARVAVVLLVDAVELE